MKKFRFFALFLGMVACSQVFGIDKEMTPDELEKSNHRYQIFIAEHNAILSGKSITMKSIFKIDLETGTVWRYRQGVDSKGKPFEEFFEIPNQ